MTVVRDDGDRLAVLLEPGAPFRFFDHSHGAHPWSGQDAWGGTTVLMLNRDGDAYGVWKFFVDGVFAHWYLNFESPVVRTPDGFDTDDHGLDLIVWPNGSREWKDVDHLSAMLREERMTEHQVVGVLHAAAEVYDALSRGERWWSEWDDWQPE